MLRLPDVAALPVICTASCCPCLASQATSATNHLPNRLARLCLLARLRLLCLCASEQLCLSVEHVKAAGMKCSCCIHVQDLSSCTCVQSDDKC